jgi:hypothetical protein
MYTLIQTAKPDEIYPQACIADSGVRTWVYVNAQSDFSKKTPDPLAGQRVFAAGAS